MDIVVYVDKLGMPGSDCIDAHSDLDLRCPHCIRALFMRWTLYISFTTFVAIAKAYLVRLIKIRLITGVW